MMHGITDEDWMKYFDGDLEPAAIDRIEAHFIGCRLCWDFYDEMANAEERLRAGGAVLRSERPLRERVLHRAIESTLAQLRGYEQANNDVRERLDHLRAVMAPMCGTTTADRALKLAAEGSPAKSLESITSENWKPFLLSLTSIAAVMCGDTGADLVWESGQLETIEC